MRRQAGRRARCEWLSKLRAVAPSAANHDLFLVAAHRRARRSASTRRSRAARRPRSRRRRRLRRGAASRSPSSSRSPAPSPAPRSPTWSRAARRRCCRRRAARPRLRPHRHAAGGAALRGARRARRTTPSCGAPARCASALDRLLTFDEFNALDRARPPLRARASLPATSHDRAHRVPHLHHPPTPRADQHHDRLAEIVERSRDPRGHVPSAPCTSPPRSG